MVLLDLPHSAEHFLSAFRSGGQKPLIVERTRDIQVMRSLVANGFGYSIAKIRPPSDRAPDGLPLVFVPLSGPLRPMRLGLLLAEGALRVQTIRACADHARREVCADAMPGLKWPRTPEAQG